MFFGGVVFSQEVIIVWFGGGRGREGGWECLREWLVGCLLGWPGG